MMYLKEILNKFKYAKNLNLNLNLNYLSDHIENMVYLSSALEGFS